MSIKEAINKLATDPKKARRLSIQMLHAQRSGTEPIIITNGRRIQLRRVTQLTKGL
jgi:hypothetical protein